MKKLTQLLLATALFALAVMVVAGLSFQPEVYATKELYKSAKDMFGSDIKGCKHCHVKALPKEGTSDLNERGQYLVDQKTDKGAEEVDISWLKEYKEPSS